MVHRAWYGLAHTVLASRVFNGSSRRLPHASTRWVPMIFGVWSSLAHTSLAHAFNCSLRRLPHAPARWVPMLLSVWFSLAHTSLTSHVFQWFFKTVASRSGAMGADDIRCLVQLGSHLARLSRFQCFCGTAASRSGAMDAYGT